MALALLWRSRCYWRSSVPAVAGVIDVADIFAVAIIPADPSVPILADVFTYYTAQCTVHTTVMRHIRLTKGL
jgi:hypothetical protein